jgi:hypothetical protein
MSGRHDPHKGDPRQVLQDGCAECARRGRLVHEAIGYLDEAAFAAAWTRAAQWQTGRLKGGAGTISDTEAPLLRALWETQRQFERRGFKVGSCPVEF